mgnify:CR=1 FL=1
MHEMSIAEGIIEIVERTAGRSGVTRVKEVRIEVGELARGRHPVLEFAWVSVTRGGPAEAQLVIERPRERPGGLDCAKTVPLAKYGDPCPVCGGVHLAATGGTEMRVIDFVPED